MTGSLDKKTMHTIAWDKIYRPKCETMLAIRKIEDISAVFLA